MPLRNRGVTRTLLRQLIMSCALPARSPARHVADAFHVADAGRINWIAHMNDRLGHLGSLTPYEQLCHRGLKIPCESRWRNSTTRRILGGTQVQLHISQVKPNRTYPNPTSCPPKINGLLRIPLTHVHWRLHPQEVIHSGPVTSARRERRRHGGETLRGRVYATLVGSGSSRCRG